MAWTALADGIVLSAGLIIAIGAQNTFVIRQGVTGKHLLAVALTCIGCDILLISLGALGVGTFIQSAKVLRMILVVAGIAFLAWYGITAWVRAFRKNKGSTFTADENQPKTLSRVVLMGIGFSVLNPHALLDTVVVIGSLATKYETQIERIIFTAGAVLVSMVWFFSLAYAARLLQNLFKKPITARIFDGLTGAIMLWLMGSLVISEFV